MQILDRKTVGIPGPGADASPEVLEAAKDAARGAVPGVVGAALPSVKADLEVYVDDTVGPSVASYLAADDTVAQAAAEAVSDALANNGVVTTDKAEPSEVFFAGENGVESYLGVSRKMDATTGHATPPVRTTDALAKHGRFLRPDTTTETGFYAENGTPLWLDWEAYSDPLLGVVPPTLLAKVAAGGVIISHTDPSPRVPAGVLFVWINTADNTGHLMQGDAA